MKKILLIVILAIITESGYVYCEDKYGNRH